MWHVATWLSGGLDSIRVMIGLNDIKSLFQPKWFCVIPSAYPLSDLHNTSVSELWLCLSPHYLLAVSISLQLKARENWQLGLCQIIKQNALRTQYNTHLKQDTEKQWRHNFHPSLFTPSFSSKCKKQWYKLLALQWKCINMVFHSPLWRACS